MARKTQGAPLLQADQQQDELELPGTEEPLGETDQAPFERFDRFGADTRGNSVTSAARTPEASQAARINSVQARARPRIITLPLYEAGGHRVRGSMGPLGLPFRLLDAGRCR